VCVCVLCVCVCKDAHQVKKLIEDAAWYYGISKFVTKFYSPHKKEYAEQYKCWPPPLLVPLVSIFILVVFIYYVEVDNRCGGESLGRTDLACPEVFDSIWAYHFDSAYKNEWWRFITYMCLHAGAAHITSNLFLQVIVGIPLEMVHGSLRVFALYLLGGIAGSCCVSIFDDRTNIVGASAGVYALTAAHVATILNYWSIMEYKWIRLFIFGLIFGLDFGWSLYKIYAENDHSVSYTSHLGGALLGFALGTPLLDEIPKTDGRAWKYFFNYFGIVSVVICFLFALIWNLVNPQKP